MATTKEKVRERVIELLDDIRPLLEKRLDYFLEISNIDYEKEEDNYRLPKYIMQALSEYMLFINTNQYATRKDKDKVKYIKSII
jgi:hypothetical protein